MPLPPRGRPLPSGAAAQATPRAARAVGRAASPEGAAPMERFPALDAVRGLAALAVVAFHAYKDLANRPGWDSPLGTFAYSLQWAVPVFFVLSGFLLYRPFAAAIARGTPRPGAGAFLWRRATRILPAYWLALIAFGSLVKPGELWSADGVVRYGLLLQVFDADTVYHILGTAWSLSIEAGFYIALPVLAWVVARLLVRRGGPVAHLAIVGLLALAATGISSLVLRPLAAAAGQDPGMAGFTVAGSFGPFAAGMALAVVTVCRSALRRRLRGLPRGPRLSIARLVRRDGPWLAIAALAFSAGLLFEARHITPWDSATGATLAAAALLAPLVLRPRTSRLARLLGGSRALVGLGAVSYGLYLWHWPIQEVIRTHGFAVPNSIVGWAIGFLTTGTLGLLAAIASYRFVEAPINRWARGPRRGRGEAAVGGLESGAAASAAAERVATRRSRRARPVAGAES
ncbi:MAG TPA: acyltransferase [Candidatus Limnocylindrales bacterium]|nr:acyltransferase [Candidatus Limnocylindrales bacterium]